MLLTFLPATLVGALAFVALITSPVLGFLCLLPFALLKFAIPVPALQRVFGRLSVRGAQVWVLFNRLVYRICYPVAWRVELPPGLSPEKKYLLICNHQSWIDILLIAELFYQRAEFPRFFLKHELLYVPVIGLGCWAMEMPFMHRHSKEDIRKNPALKDQDLATTRKFCERYKDIPVLVVNFVEGTRFTEKKRVAFGSPYRHLLRPKSAGLRVALDAMGEQFDGILDMTIAYRPARGGIVWSFLRGEQNQLAVHVDLIPMPQELLARADEDDPAFRAQFHTWVNNLWAKKDARLDRMLADSPAPAIHPQPT